MEDIAILLGCPGYFNLKESVLLEIGRDKVDVVVNTMERQPQQYRGLHLRE